MTRHIMKQEIIKTAKIVAIGILLSFGVSYVFSGSYWQNAGENPTGGNVKEIVNVLNTEQTKTGTLKLTNGAGTAKLSADMLEGYELAYFGSKVDIGKRFFGGGGGGEGLGIPESTLNTNLFITGKLAVNLDAAGIAPTAAVHADGTMRIRPLALEYNEGITYNAGICADALGTLILCDSAFTFSWNTTYIDVGMNECDFDQETLSVVPTGGLEPYTATWTVTAPGAIYEPNVTGSGLSRTITYYKNDTTSYETTISVTLEDSDDDVPPVTKSYVQTVPVQPESVDGSSCTE